MDALSHAMAPQIQLAATASPDPPPLPRPLVVQVHRQRASKPHSARALIQGAHHRQQAHAGRRRLAHQPAIGWVALRREWTRGRTEVVWADCNECATSTRWQQIPACCRGKLESSVASALPARPYSAPRGRVPMRCSHPAAPQTRGQPRRRPWLGRSAHARAAAHAPIRHRGTWRCARRPVEGQRRGKAAGVKRCIPGWGGADRQADCRDMAHNRVRPRWLMPNNGLLPHHHASSHGSSHPHGLLLVWTL